MPFFVISSLLNSWVGMIKKNDYGGNSNEFFLNKKLNKIISICVWAASIWIWVCSDVLEKWHQHMFVSRTCDDWDWRHSSRCFWKPVSPRTWSEPVDRGGWCDGHNYLYKKNKCCFAKNDHLWFFQIFHRGWWQNRILLVGKQRWFFFTGAKVWDFSLKSCCVDF